MSNQVGQTQQPTVRVATFNCEWRRTRSSDAELIRQRVFEGGADVLCLTETHKDFLEGQGHSITSEPLDQGLNTASRRKVLLWSQHPWESVEIVEPAGIPGGRYVAGVTKTPVGDLKFIGVCIPYRWAGVRYEQPKRAPWELHLAYLNALDRTLATGPRQTVLLGDFNQRVPRKYQPKHLFNELSRVLLGRFAIATAGTISLIDRQAIDHLCYSRDLAACSTSGLSNSRPGGGEISDHFGVRVELAASVQD